MSPQTHQRRRFARYNAHRDQIAIDGVILPGSTLDELARCETGTVFRVEHGGDYSIRLHRIETNVNDASAALRDLARRVRPELADQARNGAAAIEFLGTVVADLARQRERAETAELASQSGDARPPDRSREAGAGG